MSKKDNSNNTEAADLQSEDDLGSQIEEENYDNVEYKLNTPDAEEDLEIEAPDIVLIDSAKIDSLKKDLETKSLKALKTLLKIFSICFNEKELKNANINYQIQNAQVMNEILDIFFQKVPKVLKGLHVKETNDLLRLIYLKNCLYFLSTLDNEALIIRTLKGIKEFYPMFIEHKSLNKKLIREVLNIWGRDNNLSVKFNSFILLKVILKSNDNEFKDYIYKNMVDKMVQYTPHWNWHNFDTITFTRNCVIEAVSISKEVAYIIIYEKIRNISSLYLEVCKEKVN